MFELWAKRVGASDYEFVCSYQDYENQKHYSMLDMLDNGEYDEAIILRDKFYVLMKIYKKGKVLRK